MSDSVRPHRRQPIRLHRPWDSPGKNTGVGCHFLLQCMKVKSESEVAQSCPTLSNLMDCSLPGSPIHGIFQARILEWGAIAFSEMRVKLILNRSWDSHIILIRKADKFPLSFLLFFILKVCIYLIDKIHNLKFIKQTPGPYSLISYSFQIFKKEITQSSWCDVLCSNFF